MGTLVADAAVQPCHWVYNTAELRAKLEAQGALAEPEFLAPSINSFYCVPTGRQTCYGDHVWALLQHLTSTGGQLKPVEYAKHRADFFGDSGLGGYGPYPADHVPRAAATETSMALDRNTSFSVECHR
eukprot:SAG11_NODE_2525_length_3255_cov_1.657795_4_plen_128_part_00